MRFRDRRDAGLQLAARLQAEALVTIRSCSPCRAAAFPSRSRSRSAIGAPLDVLVVRKVGAPQHREFGIGAVAEGGMTVRDETAMRMVGVSAERFEQLAADERTELERRVRLYRGDRALPELIGPRRRDRRRRPRDRGHGRGGDPCRRSRSGARRVVLAAPVSAADTAARLSAKADVDLPGHARPLLCRRRMVRRLRPDDRQRGARPAARCRGRVTDPGRVSR